jgi:universal stress protein E
MNRISDILVIVDPTAMRQPAVTKGANLARRLGASMELLVCESGTPAGPQGKRRKAAVPDASSDSDPAAHLERIAEALRDDGMDVSTHVIAGEPLHEAVAFWMRDSPAGLVVKDTHPHSVANRLFAVSTDWHFVRDCPVPVLLTKPKDWEAKPVLMAAIDPGHVNDPCAALDREILDFATSIAQRIDGRVVAVHAYPSAADAAALGGILSLIGESPKALAAQRLLRAAQIAYLAQGYGIASAEVHVDAAVAVEYVPRMASQCHADIVFMGAMSRAHRKGSVIGSTAERALEGLNCDILAVKTPDFARISPFLDA